MKVFEEIAKRNDVSVEHVRDEIAIALAAGFNNQNPEVQRAWLNLFPDGKMPTPEKAVYTLAKYIVSCERT